MSKLECIKERLIELGRLKDGWLNGGEEKAFLAEELKWLELAFCKWYSNNLPKPYICPMPDGNIRIEWDEESKEASLDINLHNKTAEWNYENESENIILDEKGWGLFYGQI